MSPGVAGDWDTGPGFAPDGAQINLPDAGTTNAPASAYFSLVGGDVGAPTQRTPNALVPSPVIFGSLPAGINPATPAQSEPWRTLLFCPYPAADAGASGLRLATGSSDSRQFLDAGRRALRDQHLHGHRRENQSQRPDRAVHLSASQHRASCPARRPAHSGHFGYDGRHIQISRHAASDNLECGR